MPKRKRPKEDPQEQFKRFLEAAREQGLDEHEAERKFKRLTSKLKPTAELPPQS